MHSKPYLGGARADARIFLVWAVKADISELGVSLFALFALFALMVHFLHFFQGAHPRSQEQVCRLLGPVFLLLFLMYGGINEIRKFACLPVLRQ